MSLFKTFGSDVDKENNGVPISYEPNEDGTVPTFFIARMGTKKYQKVLRNILKPIKRRLDLGTVSDEEQQAYFKKAFIKGCMKGWKHIQNEKGEEIPFSESNASDLLDQLPHLYDDLVEQSGKHSNYKTEEELEAQAKN